MPVTIDGTLGITAPSIASTPTPVAPLHVITTGTQTGTVNSRTGLHIQTGNVNKGFVASRIQFSFDPNTPKGYIEAGTFGTDYLAFGRGDGTGEAMRIVSTGQVLRPLQPLFMGRPTTDYSGGSMPTGVMAITALYNNGGHFNSANNRFTAPVAGWYRSTWGGLQLKTTVTSLQVNGARIYQGNHFEGATSINYITVTQTVIRQLNAGDFLNVEQWNGGGYYNDWYLWTVELIG